MKKWIKKLLISIPVILILVLVATVASASIAPKEQEFTLVQNDTSASGMNVRVYYLVSTYQAGRHAIISVWCDKYNQPLPEDNPDTMINVPFGVLEFDIKYNRTIASAIQNYEMTLPNGQFVRRFFINDAGQLCKEDGSIVNINLNPEVEAYKLSQLSGMTQQQLMAYIDTNVTNLTQAKEYLKKLSAVVLWLVKQSELEQ